MVRQEVGRIRIFINKPYLQKYKQYVYSDEDTEVVRYQGSEVVREQWFEIVRYLGSEVVK